MSVNSSSFLMEYCLEGLPFIISVSFGVTKISILLPVFVLIVFLSHRRCRHSNASLSHSDYLTYHLATMELNSFFFFFLLVFSVVTGHRTMVSVSYYAFSSVFTAELCFQTLTCVDRYVAVVYPVVYLRLKGSGGVRIRNVGVVCVWLVCAVWAGTLALYHPVFPTVQFACIMIVSLIAVTFCNVGVLCVLVRPRPGGKVGGAPDRVDQTRRRAFHNTAVISMVLWFWFLDSLVSASLVPGMRTLEETCLVVVSGMWCGLPNSLVLPLLFLHRARNLQANRKVPKTTAQ